MRIFYMDGVVFAALFLAMICGPGSSFGQKKDSTFFFSEFGFRVTIPSSFDLVDSVQSARLNEKGTKAMSEANNIDMTTGQLRTLVTARNGKSQYFTATVEPFDPKRDGDYAQVSRQLRGMTYKAYVAQLPNARIDSSTTSALIDGERFERFEIDVILKGSTVLHSVLLSRLYKGYDFGINYMYTDPASRAAVESILNSCKFH
ncbi:MAG: hypothetical protein Q8927_02500 [Bacteroidota bacterium]|nr:hypothetical protein [Bacteroidota bacterium]